MKALLKIESLRTFFFKREGILKAVDGVDLCIRPGETVALVGESGSGKSMTALSIFRLVPPPGQIVSGRIEFQGQSLLKLPKKQMARIRGKEMGLILQDALSALNPVMCVGEQISEVVLRHFPVKRREAKSRALEMMERVQLPNVERLYRAYPHQLSGGMRQRVLIATALACRPALVIADEPTTALDVSIQSQILALLAELKNDFQLSLLLITHDLGVVAQMADRVAVMYAGKVVEQANKSDLFSDPIHPYTQALLQAMPNIDFREDDGELNLKPLAGSVPDMMNLPKGCAFHPRCSLGNDQCRLVIPKNVIFEKDRTVRCIMKEPENGEASRATSRVQDFTL